MIGRSNVAILNKSHALIEQRAAWLPSYPTLRRGLANFMFDDSKSSVTLGSVLVQSGAMESETTDEGDAGVLESSSRVWRDSCIGLDLVDANIPRFAARHGLIPSVLPTSQAGCSLGLPQETIGLRDPGRPRCSEELIFVFCDPSPWSRLPALQP
jgi:hypothetical protein